MQPLSVGLAIGLLSTLASAAPAPAQHLMVLRGQYVAAGVARLAFVADEDSLSRATIEVPGAGAVTGADLLEAMGANLTAQIALYREAQRARGSAVQPLFVIVDPDETWAFATNRATFTFTRNGSTVGPMTAPALVLGGRPAYLGGASRPSADTPARNRRMLELLRPWFPTVAPRGSSLDSVLGRCRLTDGKGWSGTALQWADRSSCKSYRDLLERTLVQALDREGVDGAALWAAQPEGAALEALVAEDQAAGAQQGVGTALAHEVGHLIHFAAAGAAASVAPASPYMKAREHGDTTLSNPEFAFSEGWAEANALVVAGTAPDQPGPANRVNYDDTAAIFVSARLSEALVQDRYGVTPETARLKGTAAYLSSLQERRGQLRSRYDFLRSEYAVAATVASLRRELGQEANLWAVEALAATGREGRATTLARLLEELVHRHPEVRLQVYGSLARATEGILVTQEQAAFLADPARNRTDYEIDLDQDGVVPTRRSLDALRVFPEVFPRDPEPLPGDPDPLSEKSPASRGRDQASLGFSDLERQ